MSSKRSARSTKDNSNSSSSNNNNNKAASSGCRSGSSGSDGEQQHDPVWVQCNNCDKWRALPHYVDPESLPDIWYCELNEYDSVHNTCGAPEEVIKPVDEKLRHFFKVWHKRLRCADKAESTLSISTRDRKRKASSQYQWIRCCNPSCGKWRIVLNGLDINSMIGRLNKGQGPWKQNYKWYCTMNTWDETQATCSAPQESMYELHYNLGIR